MAELRCEGLAKSYGSRVVLRAVDLTVAAGTLTAVLGASGSGKTTLLRVVMGFMAADRGTISIGGSILAEGPRSHVPADRRAIGYVAQEGALFPHLSAGENVAFGLPRAERRRGARIAQALALVGLDERYAERRSHELSGGEQRRVALARALAPRPRVVLLDEPFSGLDAALRVETREAVIRALREEGTTALLVTHDQAEALSTGREVAVLREGRLVQRAAPTAVYRAPVDLEGARFVGEANVLPGDAARGRVSCALGELAVRGAAASGPVEVMIRPEQVRLVRGGTGEPVPGGGVRARVIDHTFYGPDTVMRLALDGAQEAPADGAPGKAPDGARGAIIRARTFEHEIPGPGELVGLVVRGPVVVFPAPGGAGG